MGRSKFPGKPSRLASKKRVSVLVVASPTSSPDSVSSGTSAASPSSRAADKSPSHFDIGYNEDTAIRNDNHIGGNSDDLINKCSEGDGEAAAAVGSCSNHSDHNAAALSSGGSAVIKVLPPCNSNNTISNNNNNSNTADINGQLVENTIVSSHNFHDGDDDKTQVSVAGIIYTQ